MSSTKLFLTFFIHSKYKGKQRKTETTHMFFTSKGNNFLLYLYDELKITEKKAKIKYPLCHPWH